MIRGPLIRIDGDRIELSPLRPIDRLIGARPTVHKGEHFAAPQPLEKTGAR